MKNVISFLMSENRIGLLPIIFKEVVVIDDHKKGFIRGVIEGREDVANPEMTEKMIAYLADKVGAKPILTYKKNENLTAGYRVTVEDLQLDATIDNQFNKLKSEILNS